MRQNLTIIHIEPTRLHLYPSQMHIYLCHDATSIKKYSIFLKCHEPSDTWWVEAPLPHYVSSSGLTAAESCGHICCATDQPESMIAAAQSGGSHGEFQFSNAGIPL